MIPEGRRTADTADAVIRRKGEVSRAATESFLEAHPDWVDRYGERARTFGIQDAEYHIDFLAGALAASSVKSFDRYVRWATGVLSSRGIERRFLAENLRGIGRELEARLAPEDASRVLEYVGAGVEACEAGEGTEEERGASLPSADIRRLYMDAALRGDRKPALRIALEALRGGMDPRDLYVDVLQGAQYEIGLLWQNNEISVAREHTATAVCQYILMRLYDELPRPVTRRGRAVITGVQGELHQLGANMVADMLEMDGWEVRFLGTQMPHSGILEAIEEMGADLVGISTTMLFNLPQVVRLTEEIRSNFPSSGLRILVGGGAFRSDPEAWREIGADGFGRDLRDAVERARELESTHEGGS